MTNENGAGASGRSRVETPAPRRAMGRSLAWDRDSADWPHRGASRFVEAGGLTFHVQVMGQGPVLLLLHGTGASTHSWRDLMTPLADQFTVVAPDLPGHAFSGRPDAHRMSLPGMARALADLLATLGLTPQLAAGHSAGTAVLAEMCLEGWIAPAGLISLNGALLPIGGIAGQLFSPLAKVFANGSVIPRLVALWADDRAVVKRMIAQTGSTLDRKGLALYARLVRDPRHAAGALDMMANWNLRPLVKRLPDLTVPLLLVVGSRDRSVAPDDAFRVRDMVPGATVLTLRGLGHLAHEEKPAEVVEIIRRQAGLWGVLPTEG